MSSELEITPEVVEQLVRETEELRKHFRARMGHNRVGTTEQRVLDLEVRVGTLERRLQELLDRISSGHLL